MTQRLFYSDPESRVKRVDDSYELVPKEEISDEQDYVTNTIDFDLHEEFASGLSLLHYAAFPANLVGKLI